MAISKIKTASITDDAITSAKIAADAVSAADVADGTLTGVKLATPLDLSSTVITAPKIANGGFIADANGNEQIKFTTTASAVNEITVINSATGSAPEIQSTGGDTNIDLKITPKGTGKLVLDGISFPNADGSANQVLQTNGSGVLSFGTVSSGPNAGEVIQVVSTTKTDTFSISTFSDVTGLSASITPASASNKILVIVDIQGSASSRYGGYRLLRGATNIAIGNTAGSRTSITMGTMANNDITYHDFTFTANASMNFLDSPNTTSSTTYKIQVGNLDGTSTFNINRKQQDSDGVTSQRSVSTITLMEIKG